MKKRLGISANIAVGVPCVLLAACGSSSPASGTAGTGGAGAGGAGSSGGVLTGATSVSRGIVHACAVLQSGGVVCWGDNTYGELGDGTTAASLVPVAVPGVRDATTVSAAPNSGNQRGDGSGSMVHTCAALKDGTVKCWGGNIFGQLGDGTRTNSLVPVTVTGLSGAIAVSSGTYHTCALLADGTVRCWGDNLDGELGNGSTVSSSVPVMVSGLTAATMVTAVHDGPDAHSCALIADGTIKCWGVGGALGNGTSGNALVPVTVNGITGATGVSGVAGHTCVVTALGTVWCWGYGGNGELGIGSTASSGTPVMVSGLTSAIAVSSTGGGVCALLLGGSIECWGDNTFGELGSGSTANPRTPVPVSGITEATMVSAGGCAVLTGGAVECWGALLGNGSATASFVPVPVAAPQ